MTAAFTGAAVCCFANEPMTPQGQLWLTVNWQISSGIVTVTASGATMLEGVLRRERLVLTISLATVVSLAWAWLLFGAGTGIAAITR